MLENGKGNIVGVLIDAVDSKAATNRVVTAARERRPMAISALAVHGVMTGVLDSEHRYRLNSFDLLVPDGQPVRWALNLIHGTKIRDRVYGPDLMLAVCARAAEEGLGVFLYGSTQEVLSGLKTNLERRFQALRITGMEPSKFRNLLPEERNDLISRVHSSGAEIIFVGLGCPRQEVWAYEFREALSMPILAVGAAFPFLAGKIPQAPKWMQDRGLEWVFRLIVEPRLWRRYVFLNPAYALLVAIQAMGLSRFASGGNPPLKETSYE